jgi:hypothetical protein
MQRAQPLGSLPVHGSVKKSITGYRLPMLGTPPPTRGRRATFALVLASLSFVLSADIDLLPVQSTAQEASASHVEAVARVSLPPGTVFLAAAYTNGLETRLSAKFRIPRAAIDALIASGEFTATLTPGLRAVTEQPNVGGGDLWHPEGAVAVSGLVEDTPTTDDTYRRLLLDLDDQDTVMVYLYASRG